MKILLALDESEYSQAALEDVANRPFPAHTKVCVLSSYERTSMALRTRLSMGGEAEYFARLDAEAHKTAQEVVEAAAQLIKEKNPDLAISKVVVDGTPKNVILEEAEKFKADLIVVGSQGKGAVTRFLLGSVSHSLALHAPCSVMIVRKNANKK